MRLDNTNKIVIEIYDLQFDPNNDLGTTNPVDLCRECSTDWERFNIWIDHPPYESGEYACSECGRCLTQADNGFPEIEEEAKMKEVKIRYLYVLRIQKERTASCDFTQMNWYLSEEEAWKAFDDVSFRFGWITELWKMAVKIRLHRS